ncbi:MAG: histidine kinase [Pseudogulbenkiania sp.]|nr:histidine kinase [Pseudogulbenkiania sp.]
MIDLPRSLTLSSANALRLFNAFRGAIVLVLLLVSQLHGFDGEPLLVGGAAFYSWVLAYSVLIGLWLSLGRGPLAHGVQVTLGVSVDIVMITALMLITGGVKGGYGVLLLPYLAVAGLLASSRYALFYAALASLALLGMAVYDIIMLNGSTSELVQAALLASAGFVTSVTTHQLARVARDSERLAESRGSEIAQLNRLNELALQSLREAVLVLDQEGRVRQFNDAATRHFSQVERGKLLPELAAQVTRWQQDGCSPLARPVQLNVQGHPLIGRMVPTRAGEAQALLLFLREAREVAEEARQLKLAALGRLTANIAHEIRNPLAAISHAAELLGEDAVDPATQRLATMVRDNSRRIDRLVEEVLALNRRDRVKPETLRPSVLLAELVEQFVLAEPAAAGRIVTTFNSPRAIVFDRGHLAQILGNLLANGWRHCQRHTGSLRIEVDESESALLIDVVDDGPGVSAAHQQHLFEPFYTTESSGTGLGLYIARELAEANDALLAYLSPGGRFRLYCRKAL